MNKSKNSNLKPPKREFLPLNTTLQPTPPSFSQWRAKFDHLGWDVSGVLLISLAIITLLGLLSLSQGKLVRGWADFVQLWLGWGSYLFAAALAYSGYYFLHKRSLFFKDIPVSRLVPLEIGFFLLLMLLSVLGGHSLTRASAGLDGGQIGWGIVELLAFVIPVPVIGVISAILAVICILHGLNLAGKVNRMIESWAERVLREPGSPPASMENTQSDKNPAGSETTALESAGSDDVADFNRRSAHLPPLELLSPEQITPFSDENIHVTAKKLETTLAEFGIPARVVGFRVGPTVTQFAVEPGFVERTGPDGQTARHKVRVSQISALTRDLALALSAERLRIEAPVPGQSFVGIEVPNPRSSIVGLRSVLESEEFQKLNVPLSIALGKDVSGRPVVADLSRMPHLLIAGTTGSGKSVCIGALTACLVMNNTPEQLKLVMLDPKMVELVRFNGLKHILGKVETSPDRIPTVLRWALQEMDRRYRILEAAHSRNIDTYNRGRGRKKAEVLPRIVIMIDELADLLLAAPDQVEHSIVRLAQMARATGIHLVVATQRPSTDVITGLIKANFPARISFNVASSVDSRVILDGTGAETLLGKGDMLFLNPERSAPIRAQGVIITDNEIDKIIEFWRDYDLDQPETAPWEEMMDSGDSVGADKLVEEAIKVVRQTRHASASLLQRRLRIGYPRAARLIDELEELGVVGPSQGGGREREVLLSDDEEETETGENEPPAEPDDEV
jgi:S-DNA-T family DNA segregation ATPase FtsK/SpoIIIE